MKLLNPSIRMGILILVPFAATTMKLPPVDL
jgi:hypothetical protein